MWMVSHFNLSVRKRQFDWNELLRKGEAFEVMKDMNGDKAPSLDGFPMAFFQSCWDVLTIKVMEVFLEFHQ
jgi:hypothetical protein